MRRSTLVLHSSLAPDVVRDILRRSVDEEKWTMFSLSGYRGDNSLLGEIGENVFRLRKRLFYRNDFARQFYAQFSPELEGTRIEGYFDTPPLQKYIMRFWLVLTALIGVPIFLMTLMDLTTGSHRGIGDAWVGLAVPPALIFLGVGMQEFGQSLGKGNEKFIVNFLVTSLTGRADEATS